MRRDATESPTCIESRKHVFARKSSEVAKRNGIGSGSASSSECSSAHIREAMSKPIPSFPRFQIRTLAISHHHWWRVPIRPISSELLSR